MITYLLSLLQSMTFSSWISH